MHQLCVENDISRGKNYAMLVGRLVYDDNFIRIGRIKEVKGSCESGLLSIELGTRYKGNGSGADVVMIDSEDLKGMRGEVTLSITVDQILKRGANDRQEGAENQ